MDGSLKNMGASTPFPDPGIALFVLGEQKVNKAKYKFITDNYHKTELF